MFRIFTQMIDRMVGGPAVDRAIRQGKQLIAAGNDLQWDVVEDLQAFAAWEARNAGKATAYVQAWKRGLEQR